MAKRTSLLGLALILVGIGWYQTWHFWASTRKWEPLNIPVSLSAGHIRSPEFEINTRSTYLIAFIAKNGFGHSPGPSESESTYQYCLPNLGTSWSLSNRGQTFAGVAMQECDSFGRFEAGKGRYVLDVEVSHDGSQFNSLDPHLAIFEWGGKLNAARYQGSLAFWASITLTTLGAAILFRVVLLRWEENAGSLLSAWPLTQPQSPLAPLAAVAGRLKGIPARRPLTADYLTGDSRSPVRRPFTGLSSFALTTAIAFLLTFISISVLQSLDHRVAMGLAIHLPRQISTIPSGAGMQPLLVRLELSASIGAQLYVDYQPVAWRDFDVILRQKLVLRPPNWPVYVEGEPDLEWKWVLKAVDGIRGQQAEVILLTRRTPSSRQPAPTKGMQIRRRTK